MEFKENYTQQLQRLNEYQKAAVFDESNACLVNANVGSGKTTVLITKVMYLHYEKQIPYEQMVVLTFTNKAADEIKERLYALEPEITEEQLWGFGTFHSVCLTMLKKMLPVENLGYTKEFMVMDPDEELGMAEQLILTYQLKIKYKNRLKKRLEQKNSKYQDDIEKLKADKEETENSLEEVTEQKNSLTANISINKRIMDETQKLKTELDESGKRYSTYLNISQTANGELSKRQKIAFEQYIQSAYFRSILNEANKRFSYMTNGRFELVKHDGDSNLKSHSGLDIDVFDNYTGKQRSVKSLSGGESFKASLCMALGLSEVIQRNAGGVKLESMFVDEGFGVLDNESLEQAIEVLNSLSESDRMVGIISHISELKDRIDKKIVVKKGSAGSTVELIN